MAVRSGYRNTHTAIMVANTFTKVISNGEPKDR